MDSKLSIFLLLTTVAGSSLALDTGSCATETTIEATLATIQLAEDTPIESLKSFAQLINGEILTTLTEKSEGISINSEEAESRAESAEKESLDAFLRGIPPTVKAIAILQTELDVSASVNIFDSILQEAHTVVWTALKTIRNADNYSEAQSAFANSAASGKVATQAAIDGLFDTMLNGTAVIPEEAEDVIACVSAQAASELLAAAAGIFAEIGVLLEAIYDAEIQTNLENYLCQIAALHKEVLQSFRMEVFLKVSVLRNLVIADYLAKNGTVTGLFALQSASGAS